MASEQKVDLLVLGGGINGAGIARDAAGRGLKVMLCEQGDLAGATSSASTKLIHGGLRYLEQYEFRLVREALSEREVLLALAPHIIWPLRFVLPHEPHLRPAWLIRLGLFLYDHLGGRKKLPASQGLNLRESPLGQPLQPRLRRGFVYSDCWVEDSRLVILNAMDAAARGATICPRTRCIAARPAADGLWQAVLRDQRSGRERNVTARALVNAAGPWVEQVLRDVLGRPAPTRVRLVKGSHIVVPRLYEGEQAYLLQNADRRIVFTIPYEGAYTLIGTTDVAFAGDPAAAAISAEETAYLCQVVGSYFTRTLTPSDVVWSYAGVRPLHDDSARDAAAVTRDYVLELEQVEGAPLLSVFGGKITTYRRLAEQAMAKLAPHLSPENGPWTHDCCLPGGDLPGGDFQRFLDHLGQNHPWLPAALARRYARAYGTRTAVLLGGAMSLEGLDRAFGDGIYEAELRYLVTEEWAMEADDMLYRRSRLGLHVSPATRAAVTAWFDALPRPAPVDTSAGEAAKSPGA